MVTTFSPDQVAARIEESPQLRGLRDLYKNGFEGPYFSPEPLLLALVERPRRHQPMPEEASPAAKQGAARAARGKAGGDGAPPPPPPEAAEGGAPGPARRRAASLLTPGQSRVLRDFWATPFEHFLAEGIPEGEKKMTSFSCPVGAHGAFKELTGAQSVNLHAAFVSALRVVTSLAKAHAQNLGLSLEGAGAPREDGNVPRSERRARTPEGLYANHKHARELSAFLAADLRRRTAGNKTLPEVPQAASTWFEGLQSATVRSKAIRRELSREGHTKTVAFQCPTALHETYKSTTKKLGFKMTDLNLAAMALYITSMTP